MRRHGEHGHAEGRPGCLSRGALPRETAPTVANAPPESEGPIMACRSTRAGGEAGYPPPGSSGDDVADPSLYWICACGDYTEDGSHCLTCGRQPPWGCPCDGCQSPDPEDHDDYGWEDYP